ncbi:hypothetical protein L1049_017258 [Liquidambar formosana]|uniref:Phytocyanin domain-containing protein n=1 Tax=Liquidambar formosana TaxID=63359 RepID=A0AAP0S300_LIQFO
MGLMDRGRSLAFLVVISGLQLSAYAAVYKVGDSAGWTTIGNVDYKQWAATKSFQVGDIILFEYNVQFHNVMRVTHAQYKACNASVPIANYTTGNDSITISTHGHHFFLCGFPGHCQAGQRVDIYVLRASAPSPSAVPPPVPGAPGPSLNDSVSLKGLNGLLSKLGLSFTIFAALVSGFT